MDNDQTSNEMQALMQHMVSRELTIEDSAYLFARSIGDMLAMFCEDDDDKALVLASLVCVSRVQAGLPVESH